jgi:lysophospholipase L1-like esterase
MKFSIVLITRVFLLLLPCLFSIAASCKKKEKVNPDDNTTAADTSMIYYAADNSFIQYTGRIDFSNPAKPSFSYPGISIKAKFQGSAIDIVMKDFGSGGDQGTNYYHILIDGALYKVLQVNNTDTLYTAARGLSDGDHTIEVFKRTEASVGRSQFWGFRIRKNKNLLALPSKPERKIEFIGDSFTCGYGNEVSIPNPGGNPNTGFHSVNENNYSAWGAIVCRNFDAQYHCTAYSGRGLYRNNTGATTETMPLIYTRTLPNSTNPTWNTSDYIPDLIVIHLGTNDFFPESWGTPSMVDSAQFVSTYINFVSTLRGYYPSAHIICVVPNSLSNWWPVGFNSLTRIKSYIDATVDHHLGLGDNKVHYFELTTQTSPYGEDWHPSNATHLSMANQIKPFIQTIMGW